MPESVHPAAFDGLRPGDHDFSVYLQKMGGEEFWKELTDYQGRRSLSGPRAGYNYRTKAARDPAVAADLQARLDALYDYWRSRGWSPMEAESPPLGVQGKEIPTDLEIEDAKRQSPGNYIRK